MSAETILRLENEFLAFFWNADASGELLDRASGTRWRMGRVAIQETGPIVEEFVWHRTPRTFGEEYPGRFKGRREGEGVRFTLLGRLGREQGSFTCRARLDGPWLELRIVDVDEALPSLIFPPPLESESLVLPLGIGRWVREPLQERLFHLAFGDLAMRWFGGLRGAHGWLGVFAEGHADAGVHALGLSASPGWLKSLGRWNSPRAIRYRATTGGYVGMAKAFRQWAQEHGLFRSLREKVETAPALGALHGGRILAFHQSKPTHVECYEEAGLPVPEAVRAAPERLEVRVTHADALKIAREARALGMQKGLLNVRGWIRGGYDESHPDIWPPEPALGTQDELRALLAGPFPAVLHDNYQDIYAQCPSFPRGVLRMSNGEPLPGGLWWGGQAYILCSREGLRYARENWKQIRALRPSGMFIDTTTAAQLYECRDPEHPVTRAEDERLKVELLRSYREQGQVVGSEEGRDFGVPVADFYENRHLHVPGQSVPLWPLVYHDAIVCARYQHPTAPDPSGHGAPNLLADLLWGYALHWNPHTLARWKEQEAGFRRSLAVDAWHARVGLDEMLDHRYLGSDGLVERTEFSSGLALVANFAAEPREAENVTVPAGGHAVLER